MPCTENLLVKQSQALSSLRSTLVERTSGQWEFHAHNAKGEHGVGSRQATWGAHRWLKGQEGSHC